MNSLNIISGLRSSSPSTPAGSRTSSLGNIKQTQQDDFREDGMDGTQSDQKLSDDEVIYSEDEKAPLVQEEEQGHTEDIPVKSWRLVPKRFADIVVTTIRVVLSTVLSPVTYVVACFYDSEGKFSFMVPVRKLYHLSPTKRRRKQDITSASTTSIQSDESHSSKPRLRPKHPPEESEAGSKPNVKTEQTNENDETLTDSPAHNTRSRTTPDDSPVAKRSIRIKIQSDATQKKRHSRAKSMNGSGTEDDRLQAVANALKSPSSPAVTKLKYPRAPAPPRPLVPRRQPSYSNMFNPNSPKKTLILDLDETLIHSMAKGGRMSTGHMVEVKFQTPIGAGGMVIGPQVPILYYVHERPHCHEFLRKVCKWFNLVIFTASVQEYADPVIDWLERERAYFTGRYYRQHCTYRNGAYIKDLSQVEPDLSKVMILDNSPMSYIFHEDNAIPIEGWISDPTDNDLLHLVPFFEGLQYVTDVRALLALRMGQMERT